MDFILWALGALRDLFIQQRGLEHLPCARHYFRGWEYFSEQDDKKTPAFRELPFQRGNQTVKQVGSS